MKKAFLLMSLIFIFFSSGLADGKDRFGLLVNIGKTDPQGGVPNDGGKTSYGLAAEYNIGGLGPHFNFSFSLGLKVQRLPLKPGAFDYTIEFQGMKTVYYKSDWTTGIVYLKILMDKEKLIPFLEIGTGIYHLNLEVPAIDFRTRYYTVREEISKNYLGLYVGAGLELSLGHFSIFGGAEYHRVPMKPVLEIPNFYDVKMTKIFNPKFGVGVRF